MVQLLLIAMMFLAWAYGGEEGFGKWKRGALLAIPMTIYGLIYHLTWWLLPVQALALLGLYQALFYGKAIKMVYDDKNPKGWWLIALNGLLIGLTPLFIAWARVSIALLATSLVMCILGFMGVVRFSNDPKFVAQRAWLALHMPGKMKDCWFDCEGVMGVLIALAILL